MRRIVAVIVLYGASGPWSRAEAHPLVDEALRQVEEADFAAAERTFAAAEARSDLTLAELIALLEARAALELALHRPEALDQALLALASLDPEHVFGAGRPPDLAQAFARVRTRLAGRLHVQIDAHPGPAVVRVDARAADDPAGIARQIVLRGRQRGQPWSEERSRSLRVEASAGSVVEYEARVIGPGGASLATGRGEAAPLGAADSARTDTAVRESLRASPPAPRATASGSKIPWLWIALAGVAVVAVAGSVYYFGQSDDTQPDAPTLDGF